MGVWLFAALAGCANTGNDERADASIDAAASTAPEAPAPLADSPAARARIEALRTRFVHAPTPPSLVAPAPTLPSLLAPAPTLPKLLAPAPTLPAPVLQPVAPSPAPAPQADPPVLFGRGVATGFERTPGVGLLARMPDAAKHAVLRAASVHLPEKASGAVHLEDDTTHVAIAFALDGASEAPIALSDGLALYAGAWHGADVVHRPRAEGTEDFVVLEQKPAHEELRYQVDVSHVAGLRLVGNVLEFLDDGGAPRLRMAPPFVVDANGERTDATIAVDGCGYDTNPAGPWGRPVTKAGADRCAVRVTWSGAAYPAVVDPNWVATGSMTVPRRFHTSTALASGKVLVAGGFYDVSFSSYAYLSTVEIFDGTGTFAATGSMSTPRYGHSATLLTSGKVLVAGGADGSSPSPASTSAELFDEASGAFTKTANLSASRWAHTATLFPSSGKVLLAGGGTSSAELFDGTGTFTPTGSMSASRTAHTATLLPSGKVLIAGGNYYNSSSALVILSSAELFDGTSAFTSTGSMTAPRFQHTATLLGSGKVLLAGGANLASGNAYPGAISTAELFDGTSAFAATGSMTTPRTQYTATLLPTGRVLLAGGAYYGAELFDGTSVFYASGSMTSAREQYPAATLLGSGKVLVTGGDNLSSAELFAAVAAGGACTTGTDCDSGTCQEGVCCADHGCSGTCKTCTAGTGACVAVTNAPDPDTCTGSSSCNASGVCLLVAGQACTSASQCVSGSCDENCCASSCGGVCQTCDITGACVAVRGSATVVAIDGDTCTGNYSCSAAGTCLLRNGQPASSASACASGFASGGVCCDAACTGTCQSCALAGSVGHCAYVKSADTATCTGNYTCSADGSGACLLKAGQPTTSGATACASGVADDGVCCSGACSGTCKTCVAGTGACTAVTNADDPDTCTGTQSCSATGACLLRNGQSATSASSCLSGFVADGVCCNTACSGACDFCNVTGSVGSCTVSPGNPGAPSCAPYLCQSAVSCPTGCTSDGQCATGEWCNGASCVATMALGATCNRASQCASGNCVDGVCCNAACAGQCQACDVVGSVGTCATITGAPHGMRTPCVGGTGICAATCNGINALQCAAAPGPATPCAPATCTGGAAIGTSTCDGLGDCVAPASATCAPYACGGAACRTTCASPTDCAAGYTCKGTSCVTQGGLGTVCTADADCTSGHCVASSATTKVCCNVASCGAGTYCADTSAGAGAGTCLAPLGATCASGSDCSSTFCVDGVCCNSACSGQCEACDVAGSAGTCSGINGKPHGSRPACSDGGGDVCMALSCAGADDRTKCTVYAPTSTTCAPASCTGTNATAASTCDGQGKCVPGAVSSCGAYGCDATACKTSCSATTDCATGYQCNASSQCVPVSATCTSDGLSSVSSDKTQTTPCAPYLCNPSSGICYGTCTTSDQCQSGNACDGTKCVPADGGAATTNSGGCAASGARSPVGEPLLGVAGIALVALVGARRSRRRAGRSE